MSATSNPGWERDPRFVAELVERAVTVLELTPASRNTLRSFVGRHVTEEDVRARGAEVSALADDLLHALPRQGLRIELLGLTDADVERMLASFLSDGDPRIPTRLMPGEPRGADRRAIIRFIGRFPRRMRRRVLGTGSMIAVRATVTAGLIALKRARRSGGITAEPTLGAEPFSAVRAGSLPPRRPVSLVRDHQGSRESSELVLTGFAKGMFKVIVIAVVFFAVTMLIEILSHGRI